MYNKFEKNQKHYYGIEYPTKDKNTFNNKLKLDIIVFLSKEKRSIWINKQLEYRENISAKNAYRLLNTDYINLGRLY